VYRDRVWEWWTDVASPRLAPGAPAVLVLTRWHEDDLAGRLLAAEDGHLWQVINIPAQAEDNDDALGRAPGQYLESARGRSTAQWDAIRVRAGSRTWASLYQGRPAPAEGAIFKREWLRTYDTPQWTTADNGARRAVGMTTVLASWDMTFKDSAGSDYVVGQVWGRRGADVYLLDQVRGRWSFTETLQRVERLAARWPQAAGRDETRRRQSQRHRRPRLTANEDQRTRTGEPDRVENRPRRSGVTVRRGRQRAPTIAVDRAVGR
jgi:hypothetical protein